MHIAVLAAAAAAFLLLGHPGLAQTAAPSDSLPRTTAPQAAPRRAAPPATVGLPPPTAISEIPRGKAVLLAGTVMSPQPRTFVLNDGNASIVVHLGPTWRELTRLAAGDNVRVIGQMDPYGTPVFRAGSLVLDDNRVILVPKN